jgi:hypothetical protein
MQPGPQTIISGWGHRIVYKSLAGSSMSNTVLIRPVTKVSFGEKTFEVGHEYEVSEQDAKALGATVKVVSKPKAEPAKKEEPKEPEGKDFQPPKNTAIMGKDTKTKKK